SAAASLIHLHALPPSSAYVHLPFCRKRCHYCDFPVIAIGSSSRNADSPRISDYVETLCREIDATDSDFNPRPPPLETVFLGGGTPSLVPPRLVSKVLDALSSKFGVSGDAEISIEMDPGTFDSSKLKELTNLGINRVSLGVQAFQDELLKACGRSHGVSQVHEAIQTLNSSGIQNWSVDLISSLPHQNPAMWEESLNLAVAAQPTHISVYDLQVEKGTKFGLLYTPGEFPLPSENQSAELYRKASEFLKDSGYEHYEISSYCKKGYRCKHNGNYWKNRPFYGFGLGSASYVHGVRFSRPRKLGDYVQYVNALEQEQERPSSKDDIIIDLKELATDFVMLSLRTSDGLDLKAMGEGLGKSIYEIYRPYVETGYVLCLDDDGTDISAMDELERNRKVGYLRLSDPDGFLLSNELISIGFGAI
ncbi:hypothetical protein M569_12756, partial [Genlisea aurea]